VEWLRGSDEGEEDRDGGEWEEDVDG